MKIKYLLLFIITCTVKSIWAQHDTSVHILKEIKIADKKTNEIGLITKTIQPEQLEAFRWKGMQEVLMQYSHLFIKNYGNNQLSTISIRGSSAAQTKLMWHGMTINQSINGMADIGMLSTGMFDQIDVFYQTDEHMPAMGGGVSIQNNRPAYNTYHKVKAGIMYESLRNVGAFTSYQYADGMMANTTKLYISKQQNKFTYYNPLRDTMLTQTHANQFVVAASNDFYVNIFNESTELSVHSWLQYQMRELPPALFEWRSDKQEKMLQLRNLISLKSPSNQLIQTITDLGTIYDVYQYKDSLIGLQSQSQVLTLPIQQKFIFKPGHHHTCIFNWNYRGAFMQSPQTHALQIFGFYAHYNIQQLLPKFNMQLTVQKDVTNVFQVPWAITLRSQFVHKQKMSIYTQVGTNNRMPSLQDLYFVPGGNPNLKPEKSKSAEVGYQFKISKTNWKLQTDGACFVRNVNDWIVWYGQTILTPHNIQTVYSRGLDFHVAAERSLYPTVKYTTPSIDILVYKTYTPKKIYGDLFYSYTLATTQQSYIPNDYSINKQIPYVPRYQCKGSLGVMYNAIDICWMTQYAGYRFVTTDESQYLEPYLVHQILCQYVKPFQAIQYRIQFGIRNIFNETYQGVVGRVLPGRNFHIGILIGNR